MLCQLFSQAMNSEVRSHVRAGTEPPQEPSAHLTHALLNAFSKEAGISVGKKLL